MKREYDFNKGKRGPVVAPSKRKQRITIRLDVDVIEYFKRLVMEAGGGNYQTLINDALRSHIGKTAKPLDESTLRRVLREELRPPR